MLLKKNVIQAGFVLCLLFSVTSFASDKLIFAADIIRHGDRTPTNTIPNAPYSWPQGLGQLTAQGMQQEYMLGLQMHKRYIQENHLLPEHYLANTMYVRSSDLNRTLMSAESFLLGLYPLGTGPNLSASGGHSALPANYQPIAINTVPKEEEALLLPDANKSEYNTLVAKYVFSQPEWLQKTAEFKNKCALWQKATGYPLNHLDSVILFGDNLFVRKTHHINLPPGITHADADEIIATGNWALVTKFKPTIIGKTLSRPLLVTIANDFTNASLHLSSLKYALFAGHDITILSMMSALENPLTEPPHYASDLNFSLYENENKNYYVKITYNGIPVSIPGCSSDCPLEQFNNFVKSQNANNPT
jgi:lysosomal acid phosphatase